MEQRRGLAYGVAAYLMWGLFPLYWPLLEPAGAVEILAHRITWSTVSLGVLLLVLRKRASLVHLLRDRRKIGLLSAASLVIAMNWGTYIWGVNNGRVIEAALGYFINPLVTVLMGVVLLGERLRLWQWIAMAIAGVAVLVLSVQYGHPPWVALVLAFSFGTYGLLKKKANAQPVESLTYETLVLTPVALGYVVWLAANGESHFAGNGVGHSLLLIGTGVVTAVPLLCFGAAAIRVPMTSLGLLQYIAPIVQFLIGWAVLHETMPPLRWVGFGLVWTALAIFTVEALRHRRRQLALAAEAACL